jgi:hypothetical protein
MHKQLMRIDCRFRFVEIDAGSQTFRRDRAFEK